MEGQGRPPHLILGEVMNPLLDEIDLAIGYRLSHFYRITTVDIEAEHARLSESAMNERLKQLTKHRWLSPLTAWCSNIEPIAEPLFEWKPGDEVPDFGALSYQARTRWDDNPVRETTVFAAAQKMLDYWGLPPRKHVKLQQATHDLGCNRMWAYASNRWPHLEFIGEDLFPPRGHRVGVEDAQVVDGEGIVYVLEHAGAYRRERCIHFHEHVAARNLAYFLF